MTVESYNHGISIL